MHVIKVLACGGKAAACSGGPVPQCSQFMIVRAVRDGWRRDVWASVGRSGRIAVGGPVSEC